METITDPGTIVDLVEDAARVGHQITARLIRDWSEKGLLDYPQRQPAGKGHGSRPALYGANQRMLLLTLLGKRGDNGIKSLARIPVAIWMYWGEDYVPLRQARRAFLTWMGDPRVSRRRARDSARVILGQFNNPRATEQSRRELLTVLTDLAYTGRLDAERLDRAVRAVFEPDTGRLRRAMGHPAAPIMAESVVAVTQARLIAIEHLRASKVTDEAFLQARQAHLINFADYARRQPEFAATVPGRGSDLYEPVTAEMAFVQCCDHLLTTLGLQIQYPEAARAILSAPVPSIRFSIAE